jgi:hypothetical protein
MVNPHHLLIGQNLRADNNFVPLALLQAAHIIPSNNKIA